MKITQESLASAMPVLQAMLPAHWAYNGDTTLPCDPNWAVYSALESRGAAALFLARNDRVVGYATAMLHPHMNSRLVLVGTIPSYYAEEGAARGIVVRSLVRHAKDWLIGRGAKQVFVETEYQHSAGKLLERMGFVPNKIGYRLAQERGHA